ncbi:unnamed protein product [Rhizoctonia solani]|uniref:Uncharacterized protein n=1 Tax=Rhizoctonia solani TaxID=456999 RepID=A0A8H3GGM4_9AGAM|nr:unnamed protein product [Rhizoctonia solani]
MIIFKSKNWTMDQAPKTDLFKQLSRALWLLYSPSKEKTRF